MPIMAVKGGMHYRECRGSVCGETMLLRIAVRIESADDIVDCNVKLPDLARHASRPARV